MALDLVVLRPATLPYSVNEPMLSGALSRCAPLAGQGLQ